MFENLSNADLSAKIDARLKWLNLVADFVKRIARQRGRLTFHEDTHDVYLLTDFAEFSFQADTGQSMMGGETFTIWYHPVLRYDNGQLERQVCVLHRQGGFQEINSSRVSLIGLEKWEQELKYVMTHEKEIVKQQEAQKAQRTARREQEEKKDKERKKLEELAKHLGL